MPYSDPDGCLLAFPIALLRHLIAIKSLAFDSNEEEEEQEEKSNDDDSPGAVILMRHVSAPKSLTDDNDNVGGLDDEVVLS